MYALQHAKYHAFLSIPLSTPSFPFSSWGSPEMPSPPNDGEDQGASPVNGPSVGSYQSSGKRKVHTKKKKGTITANVAGTKYEIVRIVINEMDFIKTRDDDETANLIWNDSAVQHEKIAELRNYQRINHFPGMGEICRKDCLARNMSKMIKCQPQEYSFIPKTWIFPAEYTQFQNYVKSYAGNASRRPLLSNLPTEPWVTGRSQASN
ncbi:hypothetical protein INR49_012224 [Caranx melampygus]|nr:hypothetical protein INR49_012224 [Caranx melampygus]